MAYKCYKGSTLIKKLYVGSTRIKKVYKGSTLVWRDEPYDPNTVVYESSTGGASRTLNLEAGLYQVILVGAGGGGCGLGTSYRGGVPTLNSGTAASGGSGSGLNCIFNLPTGSYAILVGSGGSAKTASNVGAGNSQIQYAGNGGNSKFGTTIAYGGGGGSGQFAFGTAGAAGSAPTITYTRTSTSLNTAGNAGNLTTDTNTSVSGGASVYSSKGKGGNAKSGNGSTAGTASNGGAGYVKVIYIGQP